MRAYTTGMILVSEQGGERSGEGEEQARPVAGTGTPAEDREEERAKKERHAAR